MVAGGISHIGLLLRNRLMDLKKNLDGKQVPKVFSRVCLFWADHSVFYRFHFSLFFKENTCIFMHSVCAPQLSSNRINKNLQYMKPMIGRARIRTRSPEGSTVIVIITHNRVLHAVNNNFIIIKTMFVTPGGVRNFGNWGTAISCQLYTLILVNSCTYVW